MTTNPATRIPARSLAGWHPTATGIRCAIYVRISTEKQKDGASLDDQETDCRAYAAAHGYVVTDVYRDVWSASEWRERPGLTRLREAVRVGDANLVLVWKLDRFTRDQNHLGLLVYELEKAGARLESVKEQWEETAVGKFLRAALAFVAELERENILIRTSRGREHRRKEGKPHPSNRPPYGYCWHDPEPGHKTKLAEEPSEARIVRRVFAEVAASRTLRSIAAGLTADAVPTRRGQAHPWHFSAVREIVVNPVYIGRYTAGRTVTRGKVREPQPESTWVTLDGVAPPLIDLALWQAANARIANGRLHSPRRNANPEKFLLRAGHVVCGVCGWNMAATNQEELRTNRPILLYRCVRARRHPWACHEHTISAPTLDAAVWRKVAAMYQEDAVLDARLAEFTASDTIAADLAAVEDSVALQEAEKARLERQLAKIDDRDIEADYLVKLSANAKWRRSLLAERAAIATRQEQEAELRQRVTAVREQLRATLGDADALTYEQKRLALAGLGVTVRVWPQTQTPRFVVESEPLNALSTVFASSGRRSLAARRRRS
jgi:site-specific DNA recombinase